MANDVSASERLVGDEGPETWNLRLYVAGVTAKSLAAFVNLKRICEEHLSGRYSIEVVDLREEPVEAIADQVIAVPTVVRKAPPPSRRVIGNLSDTRLAVERLGIPGKSAA